MRIVVHAEEWRLKQVFRIANRVQHSAVVVTVSVEENGNVGRGECRGVSYLGETPSKIVRQIQSVSDCIDATFKRENLVNLLQPGGARNALDCALWDLEAKQTGQSIWNLVGITPRAVTTYYTIGLESSPQATAKKALEAIRFPCLKLKLDNVEPMQRIRAVREARPDATIVVDANQSWGFSDLEEYLPDCIEQGVRMIEQPLPRGGDERLEGFESPILLAADESCQSCADIEYIARRYGMVNIKLDKTGGLTEALSLAKVAKEKGCQLMVGNMLGTSLAMAPAFVVAQMCQIVDIDGPLLLEQDCPAALRFDDAVVYPFNSQLWG